MSGIFNLAFGDVDETGEINDSTISNNGDRNKILANSCLRCGHVFR
jgi:uncharacterized OB-fold protein